MRKNVDRGWKNWARVCTQGYVLALLVDRRAQIGREEGQQQFFFGVMVGDRGWINPLRAAIRALEVIGRTREQFLLGFGVGVGVKKSGQFDRDRLTALGTWNAGFYHNISLL